MDRQNARRQEVEIKNEPMERTMEKLGRHWDGQYSPIMMAVWYPRSHFQSFFFFFFLLCISTLPDFGMLFISNS